MAGIMTGSTVIMGGGVDEEFYTKRKLAGHANMSTVKLAGWAEDALSYFVSKHGVVTLTRSFSQHKLFWLSN